MPIKIVSTSIRSPVLEIRFIQSLHITETVHPKENPESLMNLHQNNQVLFIPQINLHTITPKQPCQCFVKLYQKFPAFIIFAPPTEGQHHICLLYHPVGPLCCLLGSLDGHILCYFHYSLESTIFCECPTLIWSPKMYHFRLKDYISTAIVLPKWSMYFCLVQITHHSPCIKISGFQSQMQPSSVILCFVPPSQFCIQFISLTFGISLPCGTKLKALLKSKWMYLLYCPFQYTLISPQKMQSD